MVGTDVDLVSIVTWNKPLVDQGSVSNKSCVHKKKRQRFQFQPIAHRGPQMDTFRMQARTRNHSLLITPQVQSPAQLPPGIIQHINNTHINWISPQPGVANFARSIITRMGVGFDISILEEDPRLATLSNILCPEATVACSSSAIFLQMLASTPASRPTPNYVLSPGVNKNITCLPLSDSSFPINGFDTTILCHLKIPLL